MMSSRPPSLPRSMTECTRKWAGRRPSGSAAHSPDDYNLLCSQAKRISTQELCLNNAQRQLELDFALFREEQAKLSSLCNNSDIVNGIY